MLFLKILIFGIKKPKNELKLFSLNSKNILFRDKNNYQIIFFIVIRVDLRILDEKLKSKISKLYKIMTFDFLQHLKQSIYK